jgi:hypothetical protein
LRIDRVELRKEQRHEPIRRPRGAVTLKTASGDQSVHEVKNISRSGISVHVEHAVAAAAKVAVEYADPAIRLQVNGTVAWCLQRQASAPAHSASGGYDLGIELASPMLFRAIYEES